MNYLNVRRLLLAAGSLLVLAGTANAELVLNFSVDGGPLGNSFIVQEGSLTTIEVFLTQTGLDTTLTDEGLFGFGLTGTVTPQSSGRIVSADANSLFDFPTINEFSGDTVSWEASIFLNSIPNSSSIQLGSFQFDKAGASEATILFGDIRPGSGTANANWASGLGRGLDEEIFGSGAVNQTRLTLSSTAVPEPSSLALMGLGSMALLYRRQRRTKKTLQNPPVSN